VRRQIEVVVDGLRHVHHAERPAACSASFIAENAVSSPPMVMSCDTLRRRSDCTAFSSSAGLFEGSARAMPICEPPRNECG
jgi:hypothetical protein